MSQQRRISRVVNVPPLTPGFFGHGHLAAHVVSPEDFTLHDPFILLTDDHFDTGDRPFGEPHPHAGFETVTLMLDGAIYDRDAGAIAAGEMQWMTAGRGIIHGEHMMTKGNARVLQLWLTLPKERRWDAPGLQMIHTDAVPVRREPGVEIRVYSGTSGSVRSATQNQVPVTIVEMLIDRHRSVDQEISASYNGFVFPVRGSVRIGENAVSLKAGEVGWLDRDHSDGTSVLRVAAGDEDVRLMLYAGQPQGDRIISAGPFIGDVPDDIVTLYSDYRAGRFVRMSTLSRASRASAFEAER